MTRRYVNDEKLYDDRIAAIVSEYGCSIAYIQTKRRMNITFEDIKLTLQKKRNK